MSITLTDFFADLDGCSESLSLDYLTDRLSKPEISSTTSMGYVQFGAANSINQWSDHWKHSPLWS